MTPSRLLVLSVLLASLVGCKQSKTSPIIQETVIDKYHNSDAVESFALVAQYEYVHRVSFDTERCRFQHLKLVVTRSGAHPVRVWKPLEIGFTDREFSGPSAPPFWNRGYIPSTGFRLPSGAFVSTSGKTVWCIIYDQNFRSFKFDREKEMFVEQPVDAELIGRLREYFPEAFRADDVYWSRAITEAPEYFGYISAGGALTPPSLTEDIARRWKSLVAGSVSP